MYPPYGLLGGRPGAPGRWTKITSEGIETPLSPFGGKIAKAALLPGESIRIETPSGGGYGNPLEREPQLVLNDVMNEYITVEQAHDEYGVVLVRGGNAVDEEETKRLRRTLAAS